MHIVRVTVTPLGLWPRIFEGQGGFTVVFLSPWHGQSWGQMSSSLFRCELFMPLFPIRANKVEKMRQYLSRIVHAEFTVRPVRISPAHSAIFRRSTNPRNLPIIVYTEREDGRFSCFSLLQRESLSAQSGRAVRCGDQEGKDSSSESGSAWRLFGHIAATTATRAFGVSTALIRPRTTHSSETCSISPNTLQISISRDRLGRAPDIARQS
jgi:hypothetical protein